MPTPEHIEALAQGINQRNLGCCIDCNAHARGKGIEHINDIEQARDIAADILAIIAQPGPAQDAVIAALIEGGVLTEFNAGAERWWATAVTEWRAEA